MTEDDFVIRLERCKRCGCDSFERLPSYSYCANCNYSPDADDVSGENCAVIPDWAIAALRSTEPHDTRAGQKPEQSLISALATLDTSSALSH